MNNSSQFNSESYRLKISLRENIVMFKEDILKDNGTVKYRQFSNEYNNIEFGIVYSDEMVNTKIINEDLISPLMKLTVNKRNKTMMIKYII